MKRRNKLLVDETGSALISTILVLFILMILGSTVLLFSVNNIKMSQKVKNGAREYYEMDQVAEIILDDMDLKLVGAENQTIMYMKNEFFSWEDEDFEKVTEKGEYYKDPLKVDREEIKIKITSRLLQTYRFEKPSNHAFFHRGWLDNVFPSIANESEYNKKLKDFSSIAFGRVYKTHVGKIFKDATLGEKEVNGKKATYSIKVEKNEDNGTLNEQRDWGEFKDDDITFTIHITNPSDIKKNLTVKGKFIEPKYEAVKQKNLTAGEGELEATTKVRTSASRYKITKWAEGRQ